MKCRADGMSREKISHIRNIPGQVRQKKTTKKTAGYSNEKLASGTTVKPGYNALEGTGPRERYRRESVIRGN